MWESLGSSYLEAATKAFPLHRAVLFAVGFAFSAIALDHEYKSIFESLASLKLSEAISFDNGILSKSTVANFLWGLACSFAGLIISRLTLRFIFNFTNKIVPVRSKIEAAHIDSPFKNKAATLTEKKEIIEFIDSSLSETRAQLQQLNAAAELCAGLFISLVAASYWGNIIDLGLGIFFGSMLVGIQIRSLFIFLNDYIGGAIFRAQVLGKSPPDLTKLR
jgi:hypothetical protein